MAIIKSSENDRVIKESQQAAAKGHGASNSKPVDMSIYREKRAHHPASTFNRAKGKARDEIASGMDQMSYGGGGGGMDNLELRVQNIERDIKEVSQTLKEKTTKQDLSILEKDIKLELSQQTAELTKQNNELKSFLHDAILKLPNEDRMKVIFKEQIKDQDIATNTFVDKQIAKSQNTLMKLFYGTIITIVVATAIQLTIRFYPVYVTPESTTHTAPTSSMPQNHTTQAP